MSVAIARFFLTFEMESRRWANVDAGHTAVAFRADNGFAIHNSDVGARTYSLAASASCATFTVHPYIFRSDNAYVEQCSEQRGQAVGNRGTCL